MLESVCQWVVGIGLAFDLFGCIGLVRLPDVYNRAQAATKCVTLGTCTILLGVAIWAFGTVASAGAGWAAACILLAAAAGLVAGAAMRKTPNTFGWAMGGLAMALLIAGIVLLIYCGALRPMGIKALICADFILLTSPVGAHAVCRGAYISGVPLWEGSVEDNFKERAGTIREVEADSDQPVAPGEEAPAP